MLSWVRSERLLMEDIDYSVLFGWFVGRNQDEPVWDLTVFTNNRNRLWEGDVAREFLAELVRPAESKGLTRDEPFTGDGTLIEAWANLKSFQRKAEKKAPPEAPGNPSVDFHGEQPSNHRQESTTDADALLARKGNGMEAQRSYNAHRLRQNRNGLIMNTETLQAKGTAEREAALLMPEQIPGRDRVTAAGDKGFDRKDFVGECPHMNLTPHVAQNRKRHGGRAMDRRTTRHEGYAISQRKRKRIEECFRWLKTIALVRKVRHRGIQKVGWIFTFAAAYNLGRMRNGWRVRLAPHESGQNCARTRPKPAQ